MLLTDPYSGFENLYFKVVTNTGLTSYMNYLTSVMTYYRCFALYPDFCSISEVHMLEFAEPRRLFERMRAAAAISLRL